MKKIGMIIVFLFTIFLSSCGQDTTHLAKDNFSKFYNGENNVALHLDKTLYFEEYTLYLDDLIGKDEEANFHVIMKADRFYFTAYKGQLYFDYTLYIYESNLLGTEVKMIFSKEHYKTCPHAYVKDDSFYIEHYLKTAFIDSSKQIDKFTISNKVYENIASGKESDIADYIKDDEPHRYSIEISNDLSSAEHKSFIITDSMTGKCKRVDDHFLENTIYFETMKQFNYEPRRFDFVKDMIFLTYSISGIPGYSHLVFMYDFNMEQLQYKLLAFTYDPVGVKIHYLI